jgi:hypothetical protein
MHRSARVCWRCRHKKKTDAHSAENPEPFRTQGILFPSLYRTGVDRIRVFVFSHTRLQKHQMSKPQRDESSRLRGRADYGIMCGNTRRLDGAQKTPQNPPAPPTAAFIRFSPYTSCRFQHASQFGGAPPLPLFFCETPAGLRSRPRHSGTRRRPVARRGKSAASFRSTHPAPQFRPQRPWPRTGRTFLRQSRPTPGGPALPNARDRGTNQEYCINGIALMRVDERSDTHVRGGSRP